MKAKRITVAMVAMVLALVGLQVLAPGPLPAGACSFAGAQLTVDEDVEAGGTLAIAGRGFFDIDGEVGADCSGDYQFVALEGITVTVTFTTPDGPETVVLDAPVTAGVEGDAERFTIGPFEVDVPADATAATVETSNGVLVEVTVTGGTPPTTAPPATTAPPTPAPAPKPADPVDGTAGYTG